MIMINEVKEQMEKEMSRFNDFTKQFAKICREIETAVCMAKDDENIQEYLVECGCWDDDIRGEFCILDYLGKYYESFC